MTSASLFPSVLGTEFAALDPLLKWVHGGESRKLRGTVTVERGASIVAEFLGALTSLPPAMTNAPIEIQIEAGRGERWTRLFADTHSVESNLWREGDLLVERLGPAALKFKPLVSGAGMKWVLGGISMFGVPLPRRWFLVSATIDVRDGRYHFLVDSALRGIGRIVRYEGLLDAAA